MNNEITKKITEQLKNFVEDYDKVCAEYRASTQDLDACDKNPENHEEKFMRIVTFGCDTDNKMPSEALRKACLDSHKLVLDDTHNLMGLVEVGIDVGEYMDEITNGYTQFAEDMRATGEKYGIEDPRWQIDNSIHRSFAKDDEEELIAIVDKAFPHPDGGTRVGPSATVYKSGEWCKSRGLDHIDDREAYEDNLVANNETEASFAYNVDAVEANINGWLCRFGDEQYNIGSEEYGWTTETVPAAEDFEL